MTINLESDRVTRELVLLGETAPGRRGNRTVVAQSQCEFTLDTDESVDLCIAELRRSDEKLAQNPDSHYEWHMTWLERNNKAGGKVIFSVVWYNEEFFNEKKDVFLGRMHEAIYGKIGISPDAVSVSHWRAAS